MRVGILFFFFYLLLYGWFVIANAFAPTLMEWRPWDGLNLALISGFGLIAVAILLSLIYGLFPDGSERGPGDDL